MEFIATTSVAHMIDKYRLTKKRIDAPVTFRLHTVVTSRLNVRAKS